MKHEAAHLDELIEVRKSHTVAANEQFIFNKAREDLQNIITGRYSGYMSCMSLLVTFGLSRNLKYLIFAEPIRQALPGNIWVVLQGKTLCSLTEKVICADAFNFEDLRELLEIRNAVATWKQDMQPMILSPDQELK